jgi:hypothetical protein
MGDHLLSNITKLKEEKKTAITPNIGNQVVFFGGIPHVGTLAKIPRIN